MGKLHVSSAEEKENLLANLTKNSSKEVNQDLKKFCEDNGIDTNLSKAELETHIVIEREEMQRERDKKTEELSITSDVRCLLDAFNRGKHIGNLPSEAMYKMFEKRFYRYAKRLESYVDKYGKDQEVYQKIYDTLDKNNKDGSNQVASLIKAVTDKVISGNADTAHALIDDKARDVFTNTFREEIESTDEIIKKKEDKFQKKMQDTDEHIAKEKDALREKIKKIQEELQDLRKEVGTNGNKNDSRIQVLEKELEFYIKKLAGYFDQGGTPTTQQDWDDISILEW